jgi:hypothetical protein
MHQAHSAGRRCRGRREFPLIVLVALVASAPAVADRAEVYGAQQENQMLTISPDGSNVAWRRTTADSDAIIVYSLVDKWALGGVNLNGVVNPSSLRWATEVKLVLVVSEHGRMTGFLGKYDVSSAWVFSLATARIPRRQRTTPRHCGVER